MTLTPRQIARRGEWLDALDRMRNKYRRTEQELAAMDRIEAKIHGGALERMDARRRLGQREEAVHQAGR